MDFFCAEKVQEYKTRALILSMEEAAGLEDQRLFSRPQVIQALLNLADKYEQLALTISHDSGSM